MLRLRLACVKHITLALLAAALLLAAVEIGLRVNHSYLVQSASDSLEPAGLLAPSWTSHHTLKPLRSTTWRNPDTNRPVSIRTNSLGLRGDALRIPKPSGVFRILYLGDETVFAGEFEEADCFYQLISKELLAKTGRQVEVVNAGLPSYCPLLSYLHFKHNLASLNPDLVLLNIGMSDVADDHYYRRHTTVGPEGVPLLCTNPSFQTPAETSPASAGGSLLLIQALKQRLGSLPADDDRESDAGELVTAAGRYAWTREDRPEWRVYVSQSLSPITHLADLLNQLSCPFVVTISPVPWQISARAMPDPAAREKWGIPPGQVYDPQLAMTPIIEFLNARAIPYCDVTPRFQADPEPERLFLETTPRFSRQGHRLFAKVVADYLARTAIPDPRQFNPADHPFSRE
jgi:hypothetical protein